MKTMLRLLASVALAAWIALPGVGSDGGDNAGGTGVWILPRSSFFTSQLPCISATTPARQSQSMASAFNGVRLTTSTEMGAFTATFIDPFSGSSTALPTNGRDVVLSGTLLRAVQESGAAAEIVVVDGQLQGYVVRVSVDAAGVASLQLY